MGVLRKLTLISGCNDSAEWHIKKEHIYKPESKIMMCFSFFIF